MKCYIHSASDYNTENKVYRVYDIEPIPSQEGKYFCSGADLDFYGCLAIDEFGTAAADAYHDVQWPTVDCENPDNTVTRNKDNSDGSAASGTLLLPYDT